ADAAQLDRDVFAAGALVATIDTGELLRRRFVIDELRATGASSGAPRRSPGILLPGAPAPEPPAPEPGTKTIEDYLADFELYRQRFEQLRDWLDEYGGEPSSTPPAERPPEVVAAEREQQRQEVGMARVVATHLLEGAPRVLIRKIDIEGIAATVGGRPE